MTFSIKKLFSPPFRSQRKEYTPIPGRQANPETAALRAAFDKYNALIFDGRLPVPRLRLSKAKTRLGQMACKWKTVRGRTTFSDYCISVSTYYALTQEQLDDVLIHEMIHYSIAYTGLKDNAPHGIVFRGMMDNINRRFGRHIAVSVNTRSIRPRVPQAPRTCLVLALKMKNGSRYLSSVSPASAGRLELSLSRSSEVESHVWYQTEDEYFSSMPRVRSLRGRKVSADFFDEMTRKMKRME